MGQAGPSGAAQRVEQSVRGPPLGGGQLDERLVDEVTHTLEQYPDAMPSTWATASATPRLNSAPRTESRLNSSRSSGDSNS